MSLKPLDFFDFSVLFATNLLPTLKIRVFLPKKTSVRMPVIPQLESFVVVRSQAELQWEGHSSRGFSLS